MKQIIRGSIAALALALAASATAGERGTPREARALFDKAVKYLAANGKEKAWAAFNNRQGDFVHKDLYVFVINQDGVYQANGAAPESLLGMKVLDTTDAAGNPLFRNMLATVASRSEGSVRYIWLNRQTNRIEPKVTFLHRAGNDVLGVGYYAPRSSADDARKLVDAAVASIARDGREAALAAFNDPRGAFVRGDLYVFAIHIDSGRFAAMGMNPALTGSDARDLADVEGKPLVREMLALAREKGDGGEGVVSYVWRNPLSNAVEKKHSHIRRVGDLIVGVGYYEE